MTNRAQIRIGMRFRSSLVCVCLVVVALLTSSCQEIEKPAVKPYFAETAAPKLQELRWSNGRSPKSLDPAIAAAAPETDVVRAIFEGLTEIDPRSLDALPGVAEKWSSSEDGRTWTFELRRDAKWSNGRRVTANDFVKTFERLVRLGSRVAHRDLLVNFVGFEFVKAPATIAIPEIDGIASASPIEPTTKYRQQAPENPPTAEQKVGKEIDSKPEFGVIAVNENTLEIKLRRPDRDLPKLLANPMFRPVYGSGEEFEKNPLDVNVVSNGPFKIVTIDRNGIDAVRSETYWDKGSVKLDKLIFVQKDTAESALDAYRKGEVDVVTNSTFAPLALKLLSPFKDFRQTTHSALNFYEVNLNSAPFSDRRVREALAIAIDRDRVADGELDGSTRPATRFLPLAAEKDTRLNLDVERAKKLLELSGFPEGKDFPTIRLVVNRNDVQQRVARTVARMWKQNLNIETDVIVKDTGEHEAARTAGDFDLIRRGVVLPSVSETISLAAILGFENATGMRTPTPTPALLTDETLETLPTFNDDRLGGPSPESADASLVKSGNAEAVVFSEQDAIYELKAIPLYFPTSYSLVKPYVRGFESNGLDAPLLKSIGIDSEWHERPTPNEQ